MVVVDERAIISGHLNNQIAELQTMQDYAHFSGRTTTFDNVPHATCAKTMVIGGDSFHIGDVVFLAGGRVGEIEICIKQHGTFFGLVNTFPDVDVVELSPQAKRYSRRAFGNSVVVRASELVLAILAL